MAIKSDVFVEELNITVPQMYVRITSMEIRFPLDEYVDVKVNRYPNEERRKEGRAAGSDLISIPLDHFKNAKFTKSSMYKKAYEYLKTLEDYEGAEDC